MKAIILAAGMGTRMKRVYPGVPKVMLPIGGKSLLEHNILHLKKYKIDEIFINLHFLPEVIRDFLREGEKFGTKVRYFYEKELLGTSGALLKMRKYLNEPFIVWYGDIFTKLDFDNFYEFHKKKNSDATLLVHETDHPHDSDLILLDSDRCIVKFHISPHPKPVTDTNLSSAAIYILEPSVLKYLPKRTPSDFIEDMFPKALADGLKMYGYQTDEYSKDMGTPERYKKVQEDFLKM